MHLIYQSSIISFFLAYSIPHWHRQKNPRKKPNGGETQPIGNPPAAGLKDLAWRLEALFWRHAKVDSAGTISSCLRTLCGCRWRICQLALDVCWDDFGDGVPFHLEGRFSGFILCIYVRKYLYVFVVRFPQGPKVRKFPTNHGILLALRFIMWIAIRHMRLPNLVDCLMAWQRRHRSGGWTSYKRLQKQRRGR